MAAIIQSDITPVPRLIVGKVCGSDMPAVICHVGGDSSSDVALIKGLATFGSESGKSGGQLRLD